MDCIYPPPLCFATQNIGEVARSDGGVEKTSHKSVYIEHIPLPLPCPVVLRGVSVREYRGSARRARGLERWHIVFCSITPSVTTCHFAYILHGKTQGEKGGLFTLWLCKRAIPLDFLLSRYSHWLSTSLVIVRKPTSKVGRLYENTIFSGSFRKNKSAILMGNNSPFWETFLIK